MATLELPETDDDPAADVRFFEDVLAAFRRRDAQFCAGFMVHLLAAVVGAGTQGKGQAERINVLARLSALALNAMERADAVIEAKERAKH